MLVVLSGWIEKVLKQAKIDTGKHKAHSTHSASTSNVKLEDHLFLADILKTVMVKKIYMANVL